MNRLVTHGVEEENTQRIYLAEMEARAFFDFDGIVPDCLQRHDERNNEAGLGGIPIRTVF